MCFPQQTAKSAYRVHKDVMFVTYILCAVMCDSSSKEAAEIVALRFVEGGIYERSIH